MNSRDNLRPPQQTGSARAARIRRRRRRRIALFASFAVIIIILVLSAVLLALEIADAAGNIDNADTTKTDTTTPSGEPTNSPGNVTYVPVGDNYSLSSGVLILVNSSHEYVFPTIDAHLVSVYDSLQKNSLGAYSYKCSFTDVKMDKTALSSFNKMMDAFFEATKNTHALMSDAYRDLEAQKGKSIAPGKSDHHTGYLVTIKFMDDAGNVYTSDNSTKYADAYAWLNMHAAEYGFVVRYPRTKESVTGVSDYTYAYRYVGMPHAAFMTDNNLCLEEYISLLKSSYNYGGEHLKITDRSGAKYEVYYIPATGDNTEIFVPEKNLGYEVSGDNDSGFIVTVKMG